MPDDQDLYKREEDRNWRERTDERLAALTSGETVQNDRLDETDEELHTIKEILEGKADDKNDNGIKGDIHDISITVNTLRALMAPDSLGQGGIIARLKSLEHKAGLEERNIDNRWKFYTAIAVAAISLLGLLLTQWDRVRALLNPKPAIATVERPKRFKSKRTRVITPMTQEELDETQRE